MNTEEIKKYRITAIATTHQANLISTLSSEMKDESIMSCVMLNMSEFKHALLHNGNYTKVAIIDWAGKAITKSKLLELGRFLQKHPEVEHVVLIQKYTCRSLDVFKAFTKGDFSYKQIIEGV